LCVASSRGRHLAGSPDADAHGLCNLSSFDELQLTDIATATLVQGVLLHFWRLGGVLLSTSNRLPSDLYGGGVQKKRIESFISCLKGRCEMVELDGGVDWRRREGRPGLAEGGSWTVYGEAGAEREAWNQSWERIVNGRPGQFLDLIRA